MSARNFPPERHNRIFKPAHWPPAETWDSTWAFRTQGLESVMQLPDLTQDCWPGDTVRPTWQRS